MKTTWRPVEISTGRRSTPLAGDDERFHANLVKIFLASGRFVCIQNYSAGALRPGGAEGGTAGGQASRLPSCPRQALWNPEESPCLSSPVIARRAVAARSRSSNC